MISVILIDRNLAALKKLKNHLIMYEDINICGIYNDPTEALKNIEIKKPDAIFLDIDNYYMSGIETATNIKSINSNMEIIFVTSDEEFAVKAFEINALDYMLKPISKERFKKSITRLRKICNIKDKDIIKNKIIQVQCLGNYNVTKNQLRGESIKWRTNKVKELFAYLVFKNGKFVSKSELIELLFPGIDKKKAQNSLYVTMSYLRKQLEDFGIDRNSILVNENYTLDISTGVCDFVDFDRFLCKYLNSEVDDENIGEYEKIVKLYKGEYLEEEDYLWIYEIRAYLHNEYEKILLSMAEYYRTHREPKKAEKALLKIISNNSLSEEGNKRLLELYIESKKPKLYSKQYERYTILLKEELDIIPEKKYLNYYMIYKDS